MRLSKCDESLANDRNKLNFSLIGDPALTLAYPDYQVQVDEFAGVNVAEETSVYPQVKAGSKITVKGRILTPEGALAEDFTGTVHPTVLDSKEEVTTLDNRDEGAFTYTERSKTLFPAVTRFVRDGLNLLSPCRWISTIPMRKVY